MSDPSVKPAGRHEPKKVFLGSTYEDLKEYRQAAIHACRRLGWVVIAMEEFGPDSRQSLPVCLEKVGEADIYVGLFAYRYGFIPKGESRSITELEYERARERRIPIVLFVVDEKAPWPANRVEEGKSREKLRALKRRLGERHTFRKLRGPETLKEDLLVYLPQAAAGQPTYDNEHTRQVSQALEAAWHRHEELTLTGGDTSGVMEEILDLKRQLRAGPELEAGDILGGRYKLLEHLGRGGFATVWRAYDRKRHETVAVKVLHGQYSKDQTRRERFFRGARKMAEVTHPGIVRVLDEHCEDDGFHYFVMEYVSGGDLRQAVLAETIGREEALAKVLEVGEALQEAHESKLIHRDVKPANILLGPDGRPKLTDFDLVRAFDSTGGTRTQAGLGTYLYMAPEAMGHAKEADVRADVYSLAMTAAFGLHGAELPSSVLRDHERFLRGLRCDEGVKAALLKATAIEPDERFGSVSEFLSALRKAETVERAGELAAAESGEGPEVPEETSQPLDPENVAEILDRAERALPRLELDEAQAVATLAWELDYFPLRSTKEQERVQARRLRQELVARLRKHFGEPPAELFDWKRIPGGQFSMGAEVSGQSDEQPVHEVRVSPFQMLATAVTNRQCQPFASGRGKEDQSPVVNIDWYHAYTYAAWLGGRLPTEAEWEYACRAGTTTGYWSGDGELNLARVGWYDGNSGGRLRPVGEKEANPWGLYDMHGNVREWVADWYYSEWYGNPEASQPDPWGPPSGERRVIRGGSYGDSALGARSAYRIGGVPRLAWDNLGFRVVVHVAPSAP